MQKMMYSFSASTVFDISSNVFSVSLLNEQRDSRTTARKMNLRCSQKIFEHLSHILYNKISNQVAFILKHSFRTPLKMTLALMQ